MIYPFPIVRTMATIVTATQAAILPTIQAIDPLVTCLNYQFGHLREIIETLKQQDKSPTEMYKKYPLVALFLDFPEHFGNSGGYPGEVVLQMAICYPTRPNIKTSERYENSIKPILLPIYYELMKQIDASGAFVTHSGEYMQRHCREHPFGSKDDITDSIGNIFADYVDSIIIDGLTLTNNFPNC